MADRLIAIEDGFWNVRGSFRVGGFVDIGTQASLVRRQDGRFVWLDSYGYDGAVAAEIAALTRNGQDVHAIVNLHPFHTVHVQEMHRRFPHAELYGTERHVRKAPQLPWATERADTAAMHALLEGDLEFSVPAGVDLVSKNENVHFSSVLAFHPSSGTIHVDDTLSYVVLPSLIRRLGWADSVRFHPTLRQALIREAGAASAFRSWARDLAERWGAARHLCAAHVHALVDGKHKGPSVQRRILDALSAVESTLAAHERRYGR